MGATLQDITIYHEGKTIIDAPLDWRFRAKANFIADFYHDRLNGYKPPKTGRICVRFVERSSCQNSCYFGSICTSEITIDADGYLNSNEDQKNKYILDLLHRAILILANTYGWEKKHFEDAYEHIIQSDFQFIKEYPSKQSPARKYIACVVLEKTETQAILRVLIKGEKEISKVLLVKRNWYWWDSTYQLAKQCKWLDKYSFGIAKAGKKCCLSVVGGEVTNDFVFGERDF